MRNFIKANARVILGRKEDEKSIGFYILFKKNFKTFLKNLKSL